MNGTGGSLVPTMMIKLRAEESWTGYYLCFGNDVRFLDFMIDDDVTCVAVICKSYLFV